MLPRLQPSLLLTLALGGGLAGCATTGASSGSPGSRLLNPWKAPDAAPLSIKQGDQVVAMVMSKDESTRKQDEDALCDVLRALGLRPIPSATLVSADQVNAETLAKIRTSGATAIFAARPISVDKTETYVPTQWAGGSPFGDMNSLYNLNWEANSVPGHTVTTTVLRVQLMVYALPQGKLLWAADSETTDPGRLDAFFAELVKSAASEMTRQGVVAPPST